MPFDRTQPFGKCTVCGSEANLLSAQFGRAEAVNCSRCGDFYVSHVTADDIPLPLTDPKRMALASHLIRKMQNPSTRPRLTSAFFDTLKTRSLPSPAEASDNLLKRLAELADDSPGSSITLKYDDPATLGMVGVILPSDIRWIVESLRLQNLIKAADLEGNRSTCSLTARGWERVEELKRAHIASRFAFFARQFSNPDLDEVFAKCLRPAVLQTGYELRTVTQRAGLVDAVIEDEIRRCRFLIADLSDDNAGAYWEAGFAEGLGKPVIYVCKARDGSDVKKTHFDANHRHTVRWDLSSLDETAKQLKAVIRNTLLGDATQTDE